MITSVHAQLVALWLAVPPHPSHNHSSHTGVIGAIVVGVLVVLVLAFWFVRSRDDK